jgi:hypothetical protein
MNSSGSWLRMAGSTHPRESSTVRFSLGRLSVALKLLLLILILFGRYNPEPTKLSLDILSLVAAELHS